MNKARLTWGIICLAVAAVLGILAVTLPEESLMFTVGNANMPYLPPLALAVVGIVLLATAGNKAQTGEKPAEGPGETINEEKAALNKTLERTGWGCFLIVLGCLLFVPRDVVNGGVWSICVGAIMLGLNIARYYNGIRMSGFTTLLGVISLISGIAELMGAKSLEGPTLFIILGAYLIFKPYFDKRRLFGKAEESE